MATKIISEYQMSFRYLPDLKWIQSFYSGQINASVYDQMKKSNTSLMFKEITRSIPFNSENIDSVKAKKRVIEIWDENKNHVSDSTYHNILEENIISKIQESKSKNILPNRFIIFVSSSSEGQYIFNKIFPEINHDITTNHTFEYKGIDTDEDGILCEFIMNKFGNTNNFRNYQKEPDGNTESQTRIPDILIVSWQVAQVGVNLPTYNYVINYHIPSIPGYLEQRYGRIDRLNSPRETIYNIYYIDNNYRSFLYQSNLIIALYSYKETIFDTPHNLPVKNVLLCEELINNLPTVSIEDLYHSLGYYIFFYHKISDNGTNEEANKQEIRRYIGHHNKDYTICKEKKLITLIFRDREEITCSVDINNIDKEDYDDPVTLSIEPDSIISRIHDIYDSILNIAKHNEHFNKLKASRDEFKDSGEIIFKNTQNSAKLIINTADIISKLAEVINKPDSV